MSSLKNSLSTSAAGWIRPNGPTRFGPGRNWMCAATLRSPQMTTGRTPSMPPTMASISIEVHTQCWASGGRPFRNVIPGSFSRCRSGDGARGGTFAVRRELGAAAVHATALLADVELELVAEQLDVGHDGHGGRVAERAERLAEDHVADVPQLVDLGKPALAVLELGEDVLHPVRALAAGRALAARLVAVELRHVERQVDHAHLVVDEDAAARADHRAGGGDRFVVERDVELIRQHGGHRRSAGDDRLEHVAGLHPAGVLLEQRAQR